MNFCLKMWFRYLLRDFLDQEVHKVSKDHEVFQDSEVRQEILVPGENLVCLEVKEKRETGYVVNTP